ncbi:hypothetical protein [Tenacibaculum sp. 190524A05c]|uniref:hypothetical protein n=1 Tax=Tenacibaculum platacis TaxID=3137852 RepID=UPI0031FB0619
MDTNFLDIDKYLDGEMDSSEERDFKNRLQKDPDLSKAFELQKEMRQVYSDDEWKTLDRSVLNTEKAKALKTYLKSDELAAIKETISEVVSENRNTFSRKSFIQKLAIAASIILISTISYFSIKGNNDLFSTTIQGEYENLPSLVNRSENADELLINGQQYFESKNYKQAVISFSKYQKINSETNSINSLSYIYNGLSYLALDNFSKAIEQFSLLEKSESLQAKKANWYKVLVYLKQDNKELLKSSLQEITSDSKNYNYSKAKKLLEQIK